MKMVKKILLGLTAAAAVVSFAGCKQVDDPNEAITGSNNDYAVDYTNDGDSIYRAYKSTSLKHAGALVKVTIENPEADNFSKMGLIFDLHDNSTNNDLKDFYIMALAGATSKKNFYVSKFESIQDIQADNFGASTSATAGNPKETEIVQLIDANKISNYAKNADGSITVYLYYKAFKNTTGDTSKGYYEWGVYQFSDEQATVAKAQMKQNTNGATNATLTALGGSCLKSNTIENAFVLGTGNALPQNQIAVYAMINPGKTLKGKWQFLDMYLEAEEIEE